MCLAHAGTNLDPPVICTYPKSQGFAVTWFPRIFSFEREPIKLQLKVLDLEKLQAVTTHSNPRWFNAKNAKVITKGMKKEQILKPILQAIADQIVGLWYFF